MAWTSFESHWAPINHQDNNLDTAVDVVCLVQPLQVSERSVCMFCSPQGVLISKAVDGQQTFSPVFGCVPGSASHRNHRLGRDTAALVQLIPTVRNHEKMSGHAKCSSSEPVYLDLSLFILPCRGGASHSLAPCFLFVLHACRQLTSMSFSITCFEADLFSPVFLFHHFSSTLHWCRCIDLSGAEGRPPLPPQAFWLRISSVIIQCMCFKLSPMENTGVFYLCTTNFSCPHFLSLLRSIMAWTPNMMTVRTANGEILNNGWYSFCVVLWHLKQSPY